MRHIVKEVSRFFGEAGFEHFLLSAYGEPLGAPVRAILEEQGPQIGLLLFVGIDKVGSQDRWGLHRASLQPCFGHRVSALVAFNAVVTRGEPHMELGFGMRGQPVGQGVVDPQNGHLARFDSEVEYGIGGGFIVAEQVRALSGGAGNDLDGFFDGSNLGGFDGSGNRTMTLVAFVPCLMHDLRSAAVLDMGAGAFGTGGAAAGAAGAEAAALA